MKTEDLIQFNNRRVVYNSVWNKIDHSGVVDNGVLYTWHANRVEVFLGNVKTESVKLHDTDHEKYFADRIKEEFFNWMRNQEHEWLLTNDYSVKNLGELIETYIDEYHHFELKDGILYVPSKESLLLQEEQDISLGVHHNDFYSFINSLHDIFNQSQIGWDWFEVDKTGFYTFRYSFKEYLKVYYNIEYDYDLDDVLPF